MESNKPHPVTTAAERTEAIRLFLRMGRALSAAQRAADHIGVNPLAAHFGGEYDTQLTELEERIAWDIFSAARDLGVTLDVASIDLSHDQSNFRPEPADDRPDPAEITPAAAAADPSAGSSPPSTRCVVRPGMRAEIDVDGDFAQPGTVITVTDEVCVVRFDKPNKTTGSHYGAAEWSRVGMLNLGPAEGGHDAQ